MTKEQKIKMFEMRLDGYTYAEIGERFGISKQRVEQILNPSKRARNRVEKYVFPNIGNWMNENNQTIRKMSAALGYSPNAIVNYLSDKHHPKIDFIEAIIKMTGMTFEEAFERNPEEYENAAPGTANSEDGKVNE